VQQNTRYTSEDEVRASTNTMKLKKITQNKIDNSDRQSLMLIWKRSYQGAINELYGSFLVERKNKPTKPRIIAIIDIIPITISAFLLLLTLSLKISFRDKTQYLQGHLHSNQDSNCKTGACCNGSTKSS